MTHGLVIVAAVLVARVMVDLFLDRKRREKRTPSRSTR